MKRTKKTNQNYYEELFRAAKMDNKEQFRTLFLRLHEKDQMELFHLLYPENKKKIADFLSPFEFAAIFEWMDLEDQKDAVHYLPIHYMSEVFHYMADDNVVGFLIELDETEKTALLTMMDAEDRHMVESLLSYAPETAGSIMTTEMITIHHTDTAEQVIKKLREIGKQAETIYYLYVVDDSHRLLGVLSLRDLILAPETEPVQQLMSTQVVTVQIDEDQEAVARLIQEYDLLAVPVLSHEQELKGIVTVDDVMDVLDEEMTEDFEEFAAIRKTEDDEESVIQTARARIPWIVILIFLGLISANLIGLFEDTLESIVALAAFIPIIMDAAGNVGTQSLAVAVRRLTVDDKREKPSLGKLIRREFGAGILIGLAAAVSVIIVVMILYRDWLLAGIIGLSLLITLSISTVVGTIIPVIIDKFNIDSAVASGPFITTINDSVGLLIYFSIATILLRMGHI